MRFILTSSGLQEVAKGNTLAQGITAQEGGKAGLTLPDFLPDMPNPWEWFKGWATDMTAELGELAQRGMIKAGHALVDISAEIAIVAAMVFLLLAMFGSARAGKYLYWTFAGYIIVQILGAAMP